MNPKFSIIDGKKNCSKCKVRLPVDSFKPNKKIASGLAPECKKCAKELYEKKRGPSIVRVKAAKKVRLWSNLEIEQLRKFLTQGAKFREMSAAMNIPQQDIKRKVRELNLKIGLKINKLTIVEAVDKSNFKCECECGNLVLVHQNRFSAKEKIKSCGCHKKLAKKLMSLKGLPPQVYSFRYLFSRYVRGAEKRKLEFSLSFRFFTELIRKDCVYCGAKARDYNCWNSSNTAKPKEVSDKFLIQANGVDRIDNEKGYVEDNVVPCCKECNYAKRDLLAQEWRAYLDRIYEFVKLSKP